MALRLARMALRRPEVLRSWAEVLLKVRRGGLCLQEGERTVTCHIRFVQSSRVENTDTGSPWNMEPELLPQRDRPDLSHLKPRGTGTG